MASFLQKLAGELLQAENLAELTVVFPNRRPVFFLQKILAEKASRPVILPAMYSVTDFFSDLTGQKPAEHYELIFKLFEAYVETAEEKGFKGQTIDRFLAWGSVILKDFDEIDKFLVDPVAIFSSLKDIKEIEEWAENLEEAPGMAGDYLKFYRSLSDLYRRFQAKLEEAFLSYEGKIYREAYRTLAGWKEKFPRKSLILAGFNALTKAEEQIFSVLVEEGRAEMFWDADEFYLEAPFEAGKYLRKYRQKPPFSERFQWIFDEVKQPKEVEFVEAPDDLSSIHYAFDRLREQAENAGDEQFWLRTAFVLNDASLFPLLMRSVPAFVPKLNLTAGVPLKSFSPVLWFIHWLDLLAEAELRGKVNWEVLLALLQQEYGRAVLPQDSVDRLRKEVYRRKLKFQYKSYFIEQLHKNEAGTTAGYFVYEDTAGFLEKQSELIGKLISTVKRPDERLAVVELEKIWNRIIDYQNRYGIFPEIADAVKFFKRLVSEVRINLSGEPLEGLQVMGLLESRVLDFDRVFFFSMNEGVVPPGKTENSFVPYDVRKYYGLPVYDDRNALYAYHIYRLFAHSRTSVWTYNTARDGLGSGEPSRFLLQLDDKLPGRNIRPVKKIIESSVMPLAVPEMYPKDEYIRELLRKRLRERGLSASHLKNYLFRPADFYTGFILDLESPGELDESISAKRGGTVMHTVMENLYKNYTGKRLLPRDLQKIYDRVEEETERVFIDKYLELPGADSRILEGIGGKNLLALEAMKESIKKFVRHDIDLAERGILEILALEQKFEIMKTMAGLPVKCKGFIDRIDKYDGTLRVIDYKTGRVEGLSVRGDLKEALRNESKSYLLQLLFYAWALREQGNISGDADLYVYSPRIRDIETHRHITGEEIDLFGEFLEEVIGEMLEGDAFALKTES